MGNSYVSNFCQGTCSEGMFRDGHSLDYYAITTLCSPQLSLTGRPKLLDDTIQWVRPSRDTGPQKGMRHGVSNVGIAPGCAVAAQGMNSIIWLTAGGIESWHPIQRTR